MSDLTDRCLAVIGALLIVTSASVGAISYAGPAAPSGQAEAVDLLLDSEERALALGIAGGVGGVHTMGYVADNTVNRDNLIAAETKETKINIDSMMAVQRQNNQILLDTYSNYLQDTKSVGTMIAMNAYVRALNNGTAEGTARNTAKQAYRDYYATKQLQIIKQWEVSVESAYTAYTKIQSSNVSNDFSYVSVTPRTTISSVSDSEVNVQNPHISNWNSTVEVQLVNGSVETVDAPTFQFDAYCGCGSDPADSTTVSKQVHPFLDSWTAMGEDASGYEVGAEFNAFRTKSNDYVDGGRLLYADDWEGFDDYVTQQTTDLEGRMDNIVNQTYSKYTQGEINSSDLLSPLQLARQYGPENDSEYGTFTLATMTSMGYALPTDLSQTRTMNVTVNGTKHTGVLLSDGLPNGDSFTVGTTYNSSQITGEQYVQETSGLYEIPENTSFTITSVLGPDGTQLNVSSVDYQDAEYTSTNISAFKQEMSELRQMMEQINERQENITAAEGGGGGIDLGDDIGDIGLGNLSGLQIAGLLAIAGLAVLWYSNREEDGLDVNLNTYRDD